MKENPAISQAVTAKTGFHRGIHTQQSGRPHRRSGFTLVELLVAITIILVLAALSVMGFKRMREKADVVTTVKRIRGFTEANALYATDHNGKYVSVFAFDEDGQGAVQWHTTAPTSKRSSATSKSLKITRSSKASTGCPNRSSTRS